MKIKLFLLSCLISTLGSSLSNIVLAYRFLLKTENGLEYSIVIYAALAASLVLPFIGRNLDNSKNPQKFLPLINILLGGCQLILASAFSLMPTFILVIISTILNSVVQSITFKCLPSILQKQQLLKVNATLQEISTIGFIFAPMFAPLLISTFHNDALLFYIDSFTFFIAAILLAICFKGTNILNSDPTPHRADLGFKVIASYKPIFLDYTQRTYLITFILFMVAFSPMAFVLALIAKNVSYNSPVYYSYPILSMFIGRLISLRFISRFIKVTNLLNTLQLSLILSGILIFLLSFFNSLISVCIVEFFLGIMIAQVNFSEKSYSQLICQTNNLAKLSTLKQLIGTITKIISITCVTLLVAQNNMRFVILALSLFFLSSGAYLVLHQYRRSTNFEANIAGQHE